MPNKTTELIHDLRENNTWIDGCERNRRDSIPPYIIEQRKVTELLSSLISFDERALFDLIKKHAFKPGLVRWLPSQKNWECKIDVEEFKILGTFSFDPTLNCKDIRLFTVEVNLRRGSGLKEFKLKQYMVTISLREGWGQEPEENSIIKSMLIDSTDMDLLIESMLFIHDWIPYLHKCAKDADCADC